MGDSSLRGLDRSPAVAVEVLRVAVVQQDDATAIVEAGDLHCEIAHNLVGSFEFPVQSLRIPQHELDVVLPQVLQNRFVIVTAGRTEVLSPAVNLAVEVLEGCTA